MSRTCTLTSVRLFFFSPQALWRSERSSPVFFFPLSRLDLLSLLSRPVAGLTRGRLATATTYGGVRTRSPGVTCWGDRRGHFVWKSCVAVCARPCTHLGLSLLVTRSGAPKIPCFSLLCRECCFLNLLFFFSSFDVSVNLWRAGNTSRSEGSPTPTSRSSSLKQYTLKLEATWREVQETR